MQREAPDQQALQDQLEVLDKRALQEALVQQVQREELGLSDKLALLEPQEPLELPRIPERLEPRELSEPRDL